MLVQKLRLQHGWSQEQLAELSGVSVRTIQRIEQGQPASTESLKSLGAVLDVSFHQLRETTMNTTTTLDAHSVSNEEALALRKARKLRGFYIHAMQYAVIIPVLAGINFFSGSSYPWAIWPALGWGAGLLFHGLRVHEKIPFLGAAWEKRQVEKQLGRKI
jgi:transcriptional regulator with XRE-family HTH domain